MINISSRNFEITEAIRAEIESLESGFSKHIDDSHRISVILSKDAPNVFKVHMQTHFKGEEIVSDHSSHNFHKALELCKDHFIKQIDKRREKLQN